MARVLACTIFPVPHIGGASSHLLSLKEMMNTHTDCSLDILSWSNIPAPQRWLHDSVRGVLRRLPRGGIPRAVGLTLQVFSSVLQKHVVRNRYDVLNPQSVYAANAVLNADRRVPTVLTLHGYAAYEAESAGLVRDNQDRSYLLELEKRAYVASDLILTVDSRLKQHVLTVCTIPAAKVAVWPNSVSPLFTHAAKGVSKRDARVELHLPRDAFVVLCPRRLTPKNGVLVMVRALPFLRSIEDLLVVFAGDGPLRYEMESQVLPQDRKRVLFLGGVSWQRMPMLYRAADIAVVPSVHDKGIEEATSISALEAAATGTPLVTSRIGGLREMFESDGSSFMVEPNNPEALSRAITTLRGDPYLGMSLSCRARLLVDRAYSPQAWVSRYVSFIRAVGQVPA